jgi:catechol 2,3-dioxygenase-like lactoylglutathione lyase family enzyme
VRPQPLIAVSDVEASSRWYQQVLDCVSGHGGDEYERLERDGVLLLQLHARDADHHHEGIGDPALPYGNGALIWFETDEFDAAVDRVRAVGATVEREPHVNPNAQHREIWLRDPDGFTVVLASPDGEAA